MKEIDATNPSELVLAFHNDYKEEIDTFSSKHADKVLQFCESVSLCHRKHNLFTLIKEPSDRVLHTSAHVQVLINNIYSSMQLLMIEHIIPSGNMYRQSMEALCMAILLSHSGKIEVTVKKKTKEIDFFDAYINDKAIASPHHALKHIKNNLSRLKIREDSIERLESSKSFFNQFSHCSKLAMALSQSGGDESKWFLGGGIGHHTSQIMEKEIASRINYLSIIPNLVDELYKRVKNA